MLTLRTFQSQHPCFQNIANKIANYCFNTHHKPCALAKACLKLESQYISKIIISG